MKGDYRGLRQELSGEAKASQTRRSRFYLVTIRQNRKRFISIDDLNIKYQHIIGKLAKYGCEWSDNIGYELTKGKVLHMHTYVSCQKAPWYKSDDGWNIQLKEFPVSDVGNIIGYIKKWDQSKCAREQREVESFIYNQPLEAIFID